MPRRRAVLSNSVFSCVTRMLDIQTELFSMVNIHKAKFDFVWYAAAKMFAKLFNSHILPRCPMYVCHMAEV